MPELLEKRLNLGAGPHGKNDWINLDYGILPFLGKHKKWIPSQIRRIIPQAYQDIINQWPQSVLLHNCKNRLPFQENEISHSFTSHFLEHIKKFIYRKYSNYLSIEHVWWTNYTKGKAHMQLGNKKYSQIEFSRILIRRAPLKYKLKSFYYLLKMLLNV